jgi:hypothetical protein
VPAASAKAAAGIKKRVAEHSIFKTPWIWLDSHDLSRVRFLTNHAILANSFFLYRKQGEESVRIVRGAVD